MAATPGLALLAVIGACAGLVNAFAMTPPVYGLEHWLAGILHTRYEVIVLGLIFATGMIGVPVRSALAPLGSTGCW